MSDPDATVPTKKKWWKETNVLIGIGGVLATIIVGVATYWLTAGSVSREYQERIKAARNDVLTAVSRSIGEGVVPSKEKVQSVLNSMRRQYGIKEQDFETPETIIDDILARVLANEFLDAKRREELSNKLLAVKMEKVVDAEEKKPTEFKRGRLELDRFAAMAIALAAATMAAMILTLMAQRFRRQIRVIEERKETAPGHDRLELLLHQILLTITALVGIVLIMWFLFTMVGKEPDIWPILQR